MLWSCDSRLPRFLQAENATTGIYPPGVPSNHPNKEEPEPGTPARSIVAGSCRFGRLRRGLKRPHPHAAKGSALDPVPVRSDPACNYSYSVNRSSMGSGSGGIHSAFTTCSGRRRTVTTWPTDDAQTLR